MNMRELLIQVIIHRYKNNCLDEVGTSGYKDFVNGNYIGEDEHELHESHERYIALQEKRITIEEYLLKLTDYQLIRVYDSQCCLDYR